MTEEISKYELEIEHRDVKNHGNFDRRSYQENNCKFYQRQEEKNSPIVQIVTTHDADETQIKPHLRPKTRS